MPKNSIERPQVRTNCGNAVASGAKFCSLCTVAADRFSITVNGSRGGADVILNAVKTIHTTRLGALASATK